MIMLVHKMIASSFLQPFLVCDHANARNDGVELLTNVPFSPHTFLVCNHANARNDGFELVTNVCSFPHTFLVCDHAGAGNDGVKLFIRGHAASIILEDPISAKFEHRQHFRLGHTLLLLLLRTAAIEIDKRQRLRQRARRRQSIGSTSVLDMLCSSCLSALRPRHIPASLGGSEQFHCNLHTHSYMLLTSTAPQRQDSATPCQHHHSLNISFSLRICT